MTDLPRTYRQLLRLASRYGVVEELTAPVGGLGRWARRHGEWLFIVVVSNRGRRHLEPEVIAAIRRRLRIDPAHHVADEEFYDL